jgi:hypothetical protein
MEEKQFVQWLEKLFISEIKKHPGCHILIIDGHSSHLSLQAIEICFNNNVKLLCIPAHSTHVLQPLDVGVYCHVKKQWRKILDEYQKVERCNTLDKPHFIQLLNKLYRSDKCFTRVHAINSFEITGHFPLNYERIDKRKLNASQTLDNSTLISDIQPTTSTQSQQSIISNNQPTI